MVDLKGGNQAKVIIMAINTFTASGNIGRDCELRVTPNGKNIAMFPLPVKQGYGEHEKTSWVNCKLFGNAAEKLTPYLTKGARVTVSGEFVLEKWTGQDGAERSAPVIIVRDVDFGGNSSSNGQATSQGQQSNQPQQRSQSSSNHQANQAQYNEPPMDFDDDIPF